MENSTLLTPLEINQAGPLELEIKWADGHRSLYSTYDLRVGCRCANCVDEWSGKLRISEGSISRDVHPLTIEAVGRYGIKVQRSDGHSTGIYSFDYLRSLCGCGICKQKVKR